VLGHALASSETLGDAWLRLRRYTALLYDELQLTQELRAGEAVLVYTLAGDAAPRPLFEAALASLVLNGRRLTGGRFAPLEVHLRHRDGGQALARALGVPVRSGRGAYALIADASSLALPVLGANAPLALVLDRYAAELLARLPRGDRLLEETRRLVLSSLASGVPLASVAARRLGLGPRTLQRRLNERGLSYRGLVDEIRREAALEYLQRADVSPGEIAFALGFSEAKAFQKAFRRWTGESPGGYRRAHGLSSASHTNR
jgi:AraC-like DNA-binding protein